MGSYVVIEGLIGAGKSTLARVLAAAWDARTVMEPNEQNPFLEPFYRDPERYAFPVQMFYLATRWRQQEKIRQGDLFSEHVVSDYLFAKDRLFAEKTLSPLELDLYDRFANALTDKAPVPDLLIWLEAPVETVLRRISERRAPGEDAITEAYLVDLRGRYERLLQRWTACPLLVLENRDMDYRLEPGRTEVLDRIQAALGGVPSPAAPGSMVDREAQPALFGGGG